MERLLNLVNSPDYLLCSLDIYFYYLPDALLSQVLEPYRPCNSLSATLADILAQAQERPALSPSVCKCGSWDDTLYRPNLCVDPHHLFSGPDRIQDGQWLFSSQGSARVTRGDLLMDKRYLTVLVVCNQR